MLVWLERLWQDVQYGCRMFAGSPGFAVIAVLSLGIGIGANCAIFSFADALLLRPLPVARPGEVLTVGSTASLEALGASARQRAVAHPEKVEIAVGHPEDGSRLCGRRLSSGGQFRVLDTAAAPMRSRPGSQEDDVNL